MRFLVVGPGAMGCLFAACLARADQDVTVLDYRVKRAGRLNREALRVDTADDGFAVQVAVTAALPDEMPEAVLICVKATRTRQVAERLKDWVDPATTVITLQNGLGNVAVLGELLEKSRILAGVTSEGATLLEPGHIRHAGRGQTFLGPGQPGDPVLERIVRAFKQAGFETRSADDIDALVWGKLIVNAGINALAALTRVRNGELLHCPGAVEVMAAAVTEAAGVAAAKGIVLPYPDPLERVQEVCRCTARNVASMLQDVLNRKTTEVAFINGAIAREGERLGLPTPVNRTLASLVEAVQDSYVRQVLP